jgi:hypothetical protein
VWNGATYYIDVFGQRFQRELEQLKKDVAKWQSTPDLMGKSGLSSPILDPELEKSSEVEAKGEDAGAIKSEQIPSIDGNVGPGADGPEESKRTDSVSEIPLLDDTKKSGSQAVGDDTGMRERKWEFLSILSLSVVTSGGSLLHLALEWCLWTIACLIPILLLSAKFLG